MVPASATASATAPAVTVTGASAGVTTCCQSTQTITGRKMIAVSLESTAKAVQIPVRKAGPQPALVDVAATSAASTQIVSMLSSETIRWKYCAIGLSPNSSTATALVAWRRPSRRQST